MENPWNEIQLDDYEQHMGHVEIGQLQALSAIMKSQFYTFENVRKLAILGIAGGNGLAHIRPEKIDAVYGIDINKEYLTICEARFEDLKGTFFPWCADLTDLNCSLPRVELVIANLFIEYIGYDNFCESILRMNPQYVSCVIQINESDDFVSQSPYAHKFDELTLVHHDLCEEDLIKYLNLIHYRKINREKIPLKNGKGLLRLDFEMQS